MLITGSLQFGDVLDSGGILTFDLPKIKAKGFWIMLRNLVSLLTIWICQNM